PTITRRDTLSLHDALPICPPQSPGELVHGALGIAHMADRQADPHQIPLRVALGQFLAVVAQFIPRRRRPFRIEAGLLELGFVPRSEEHTSELQSRSDLVCR